MRKGSDTKITLELCLEKWVFTGKWGGEVIPGIESILTSVSFVLYVLIEHLCTNNCDTDAKDAMVNKTVLHPESL